MKSKRLSVALHTLVHLADRPAETRTSEDLARCAETNPVVIRRTLAGLRDAGFVRSIAGPGGGWTLARSPDAISLGEVCRALGERLLQPVDLAPRAGCRVQAAATEVLGGFMNDAEALLLEQLDTVSVAAFSAQVYSRPSLSRTAHAHVR